MDERKIEIAFRRAIGDPKVNDPKIQTEFGLALKALRESGVRYSTRAVTFDSADAVGWHSPRIRDR
ncbi:MAG: hypothetical protein WDM81_20630 [Rhizomicrobium sp.]